jgi:hypothetical protein
MKPAGGASRRAAAGGARIGCASFDSMSAVPGQAAGRGAVAAMPGTRSAARDAVISARRCPDVAIVDSAGDTPENAQRARKHNNTSSAGAARRLAASPNARALKTRRLVHDRKRAA